MLLIWYWNACLANSIYSRFLLQIMENVSSLSSIAKALAIQREYCNATHNRQYINTKLSTLQNFGSCFARYNSSKTDSRQTVSSPIQYNTPEPHLEHTGSSRENPPNKREWHRCRICWLGMKFSSRTCIYTLPQSQAELWLSQSAWKHGHRHMKTL